MVVVMGLSFCNLTRSKMGPAHHATIYTWPTERAGGLPPLSYNLASLDPQVQHLTVPPHTISSMSASPGNGRHWWWNQGFQIKRTLVCILKVKNSTNKTHPSCFTPSVSCSPLFWIKTLTSFLFKCISEFPLNIYFIILCLLLLPAFKCMFKTLFHS